MSTPLPLLPTAVQARVETQVTAFKGSPDVSVGGVSG
jgi:hypothetical protein